MSLAEIIRFKEDELRDIRDHEVAAVYDASGNLVIEMRDDASSVDRLTCFPISTPSEMLAGRHLFIITHLAGSICRAIHAMLAVRFHPKILLLLATLR